MTSGNGRLGFGVSQPIGGGVPPPVIVLPHVLDPVDVLPVIDPHVLDPVSVGNVSPEKNHGGKYMPVRVHHYPVEPVAHENVIPESVSHER